MKEVSLAHRLALLSLLLLLVTLFTSITTAQPYYTASGMNATIVMTGTLKVIAKSADSLLQSVRVNLSSFPRQTERQQVRDMVTRPGSVTGKDHLIFEFSDPDQDRLTFSVSADISTDHHFPRISRKVAFPVRNLSEEIKSYTLPTPNVDAADPDIMIRASELATGKDDLYDVAFTVATWVEENIKYSLSTLTADASQKASWVLENRKGVCDELSTLFIAMMRSLGVPARYVSGLAYTDYEVFDEGFSPHGWAEVYFPGFGWVPFDISYQEYGFVDASHIELKHDKDTKAGSTRYHWKGRDIDLQASPLDEQVNVTGFDGPSEKKVALSMAFLREEVDLGSYNVMEVKAKNLGSSYVPLRLTYQRSKGVTLIGPQTQHVLVRPSEAVTAYYLFQVQSLDDQFIYTFTVGAATNTNNSVQGIFRARKGRSFISKKDALAYAEQGRERERSRAKASPEEETVLTCVPETSFVYLNETLRIGCTVKNRGNVLLRNMTLCLDRCTHFTLPIAQEQKSNLTYIPDTPGRKELFVRLGQEGKEMLEQMTVEVYDEPALSIEKVKIPKTVQYKQPYDIDFLLKKGSSSDPKNLTIRLRSDSYDRTWQVDALHGDKQFALNMVAKGLEPGNNTFNLSVGFSDERGRDYGTHREITVRMDKVNLMDSVEIRASRMLRSMGNYLPAMLLVALAFFLVTLFIVLRAGRRR
ncbi:MAG: transglutaminase domain-containing protein [DPANN group archaeon]|nr:transglutaminase domain-containing protein [DPANN group archaeon]